jgi:hypothetical protein
MNSDCGKRLLSNITFHDRTRVKLIGRVTGGLTENGKPLGFGASLNNIGVQTVTLESTREQYSFTAAPVSETFNHNEGQWRNPDGISDDRTTVDYASDRITIHPSPATGEFVAMVYPEQYIIGDIATFVILLQFVDIKLRHKFL